VKSLRFSSMLEVAFATLLITLGQESKQLAIVTGRVLDAQGQPVSGAQISIFPSAATSGGLPSATTGKDGSYRLVSPPYGETWICAVKESAGYPDTNALLFAPAQDTRPKIILAPGSRLELDIHLGPPDGIFEGYVVDALTRAAVSNGRVALHRSQPESMYSGTLAPDGHFLFALPSAPIEVSITAPGHLPWKYRDPQSGSDKLVLSTLDHRIIRIELSSEK
jgi:hypothetical protein